MDFSDWLKRAALTRIAAHRVETTGPGYVERFSWSGEPLDPGFKRIRVTARQCYVFSHAAIGGLEGARAGALVGSDLLFSSCLRDDGQFVSRLASDGSVLDPAADLYDIAFGLFAMAWWFRLTGDLRAVAVARRSTEQIRAKLRSPAGIGFLARESDNGPLQQNPHMHLFEAAIFLAAFTGESAFLDLADELFTLAETKLFHAASGVLPELFDADWLPMGERGKFRVEPGHHYEWVWLLNRYGALAGQPRAYHIADRLFQFARKYGHDSERTGLIFDAVDQHGVPLAVDLRIWPNLEYLKAMVSMRERLGAGAEWSDVVIDATVARICQHYLRPKSDGPAAQLAEGLWIDYLDGRSLQPKCDHVPASTLYHIMFAFTELMRHREGHGPFSGRPW
jgi:mannose/cellobiose epimerase-like protein (N-acyl-D-glucosamine 2-epimerase family)